MKLLLLTDGIYPFTIGGMQKHSFYLARFMARAGHHVTVVHCLTGSTPLPAETEVVRAIDAPSENLKIITLRFPSINNLPGHYIKESYLYSKMVFKAVEPDLAHYDFVYAKGFAAWYLLEAKQKGLPCAPVGVKFHGYEMFQPAPDFSSWLRHLLLRGAVKWNHPAADHVFSYGGKITGIIEKLGVSTKKIIEIPTGIEQDWLRKNALPPLRPERQFLFIGRYERRKGIEELNTVLRELPKESKFHFHFIGPIPASKKLVSERITYHGKVMEKEQMTALIDQCEVLVTPSHSEGMPNVIMEGMARGLAVIATDTGAVALMVSDTNGWLIPTKNPAALSKALKSAMTASESEMTSKRQASIDLVRTKFLWENVADQTLREIEKRAKR